MVDLSGSLCKRLPEGIIALKEKDLCRGIPWPFLTHSMIFSSSIPWLFPWPGHCFMIYPLESFINGESIDFFRKNIMLLLLAVLFKKSTLSGTLNYIMLHSHWTWPERMSVPVKSGDFPQLCGHVYQKANHPYLPEFPQEPPRRHSACHRNRLALWRTSWRTWEDGRVDGACWLVSMEKSSIF